MQYAISLEPLDGRTSRSFTIPTDLIITGKCAQKDVISFTICWQQIAYILNYVSSEAPCTLLACDLLSQTATEQTLMKTLKYLAVIAVATLALTVTAKADLMFLGAVEFGPNNNPDTNKAALGAFLDIDVSNFTLCGNIEDLGPDAGDQNIDVFAGAYLVVHYGRGKGGSSKGGSWEFYQVINGETNVIVPGNGNVGGDDPFGHGGISSIREFCPPDHNVPDSGTTAMLLGSALTGLGLMRRYLKK